MLSTEPRDNDLRAAEGSGTPATTQSIPSTTSPTTTHFSTPLPQNRFVIPTVATDQHIAAPREGLNSETTTHSTKYSSTNNNMTSSYDSRNSSNTSSFTTMKPCKWYRLPIIDKLCPFSHLLRQLGNVFGQSMLLEASESVIKRMNDVIGVVDIAITLGELHFNNVMENWKFSRLKLIMLWIQIRSGWQSQALTKCLYINLRMNQLDEVN